MTRSVSRRPAIVSSHDRGDEIVGKRELAVSPKTSRERNPRRQARREAQGLSASITSTLSGQRSLARSHLTGPHFPSTVSLRVCLDSRPSWRVDLPMHGGLEAVHLRDVVHSYLNRAAARKSWEMTERKCYWRDGRSPALNVHRMHSFSDEEWKRAQAQVGDRPASDVHSSTVVLEVKAKTLEGTQTRQYITQQTPSPSPAQPRHDSLNARVSRNQGSDTAHRGDSGGFHARCRELEFRYWCRDQNCLNTNNFCFVDHGLNHFLMESIHINLWARSINDENNSCSLDRPPAELFNYWMFKQGRVTVHSRRSILERAQPEMEGVERKLERLLDLMLQVSQLQALQAASVTVSPCRH